jgi:hypothetical protein
VQHAAKGCAGLFEPSYALKLAVSYRRNFVVFPLMVTRGALMTWLPEVRQREDRTSIIPCICNT